MTLRCSSCRFYKPTQKNIGMCHRFPPQAVVMPQRTLQGDVLAIMCDFPSVKEDSWCGEHKPKIEAMQ